MSRIYFHSPSGEAELRGSERAHMNGLCADIFLAAIGPVFDYSHQPSWERKLLPSGCYVLNAANFPQSLDTYLHVGGSKVVVGGVEREAWTIGLNTALVAGSDAIKLCARLHGQCEIHCFVVGGNRRWLAEMVRIGMSDGIFRPRQGWDAVISFLEADDSQPVVCSYSVCEQFPNPVAAKAEDYEAWYALPDVEKWSSAFGGLESWLELKPDNWQEYRFEDGLNGFQLRERCEEQSA